MSDLVLSQLATKYGLGYEIRIKDLPDLPTVTGSYRNKEVLIDEYGMGDSVYGPAPYSIHIPLAYPIGLNLKFNYYPEEPIEVDRNWLEVVTHPAYTGHFEIDRANAPFLRDLLETHQAILSRMASTNRFFLEIQPSYPYPNGGIFTIPYYSLKAKSAWATLDLWSTFLDLTIDLAEALEEDRRSR